MIENDYFEVKKCCFHIRCKLYFISYLWRYVHGPII